MRTVALAGMNGSIDWFCYPHVDSPSVFGALLDDAKGGRFQISAMDGAVRTRQFYWLSTNILVTRFLTEEGIAEIEDFMPLPQGGPSPNQLHRRVRCVRGQVRLRVTCRPAFDYGRQPHRVSLSPGGALFESSALCLALCSTVPLQAEERAGPARVRPPRRGSMHRFVLRGGAQGRGNRRAAAGTGGRGTLPGDRRYWQKLAFRLHLPGPLARAGAALRPGVEAAHLRAHGGHRGRGHHQPAGGHRRRAELGLPLYLDSRRRLYVYAFSGSASRPRLPLSWIG